MELTILGASGAWRGPGAAANGFLVRAGRYHLVLDFGMAVLPNLQRYLPHEQIDAMFISHEHWDHCLDLYPLFLARFFRPDPLPPLPVLAPAGVFDRIAAMEDEEGAVEIRKSFEFREVEPGVDFEVGPFAVRTSLLPHWVPNLGVRLEAEDTALAYTGDTGTSSDIEALAREADVLIAEASWHPRGGGERGAPRPRALLADQRPRGFSRAGGGGVGRPAHTCRGRIGN